MKAITECLDKKRFYRGKINTGSFETIWARRTHKVKSGTGDNRLLGRQNLE